MEKSQGKAALIKRILIDFSIFALLLASDLISKDVVMNRLGLEAYRSYTLINGVFAIYPCFNDGASFSFLSGKTGFLIALTLVLLIGLVALEIFNSIKKPKTSWLFRWSLALLISGGLGNLIDRIFYDGVVRDFIQYLFLDSVFERLFNMGFGIGNVADIYLVLGVFLICVYVVFDYKEGDLGFSKRKKAKEIDSSNSGVSDKYKSDNNTENSDIGQDKSTHNE